MSAVRVGVNALAAKAGGGVTYLCHQLQAVVDVGNIELVVAVDPAQAVRFRAVRGATVLVPTRRRLHPLARLLYEQLVLPGVFRRFDVDVVYSPGGFPLWRGGLPQVVTLQNAHVYDHPASSRTFRTRPRRWAQRAFLRRSVRHIDAIVLISESFREGMSALIDLDTVTTTVIYSGVNTDLTAFAGSDIDREGCVSRDKDGPILAVNNLSAHKRTDVLLRGYVEYASCGGRREMVIAGATKSKRRPQEIAGLLASIPVDFHPRIRFLGPLDRPALADQLRSAGMFVSASDLEAFPLAPFEAMQFGIPVVLSDIPSHREIAADAAVFFSAGNPSALAAALLDIDAHSTTRDQLRSRGARRISEFSWARNANALVEVFESVSPTG